MHLIISPIKGGLNSITDGYAPFVPSFCHCGQKGGAFFGSKGGAFCSLWPEEWKVLE